MGLFDLDADNPYSGLYSAPGDEALLDYLRRRRKAVEADLPPGLADAIVSEGAPGPLTALTSRLDAIQRQLADAYRNPERLLEPGQWERDYERAKGAAYSVMPEVAAQGRAEMQALERPVAREIALAGTTGAPKTLRRASGPGKAAPEVFPWAAERYPETAPPVMTPKESGEGMYPKKTLSDEALAVQKARQAAQKAIDRGEYEPIFDVAQRHHVPAGSFPRQGNTLTDALAKKPETIANWMEIYDQPEVRKALADAYHAGKADPLAENWYAMGQLHDAWVKELGTKKGKQAFADWAHGMGATTTGLDPTTNLVFERYGNFMRQQGERIPEEGHALPFPVAGGKYGATSNIAGYNKVFHEGEPLTAEGQPKQFNFSGNFMGDVERKTIDDQMMNAMSKAFPKFGKKPASAPPPGSYGAAEAVLNDVIRNDLALDPTKLNVQDVMWKGLKGVPGKPMMQHVNEMIERTSRITGKSPQEVLRGFLRGNMPMYGLGGFGFGLSRSGLFGGVDEQ